jgi:hypothetical protein
VGQPGWQHPRGGGAEPEHAGGRRHRQPEPQARHQGGVAQQEQRDRQAERAPPTGPAAGGDAEQRQDRHGARAEHARLPARQQGEQCDEHDPQRCQQGTARAERHRRTEPCRQDDREILTADGGQVRQPGGRERPVQVGGQQRGVPERDADQQPRPFRRQGVEGTLARGGAHRLAGAQQPGPRRGSGDDPRPPEHRGGLAAEGVGPVGAPDPRADPQPVADRDRSRRGRKDHPHPFAGPPGPPGDLDAADGQHHPPPAVAHRIRLLGDGGVDRDGAPAPHQAGQDPAVHRRRPSPGDAGAGEGERRQREQPARRRPRAHRPRPALATAAGAQRAGRPGPGGAVQQRGGEEAGQGDGGDQGPGWRRSGGRAGEDPGGDRDDDGHPVRVGVAEPPGDAGRRIGRWRAPRWRARGWRARGWRARGWRAPGWPGRGAGGALSGHRRRSPDPSAARSGGRRCRAPGGGRRST